MSTGETKSEPISRPHTRITFTRLLLGFLALCLLVWSIKTIHHALQPKYQGKTAQEWFALINVQGGSIIAIPDNDPPLQAFQHLGPDAANFLWRELHVNDTAIKKLFIQKMAAWTGDPRLIEPSEKRNFKAHVALRQMGPAADCLMPELLILAQSTNRVDCYRGLSLIGHIRTRPDVAVPLFLSNLTSTNPMVFAQSMVGLKQYGPQASNALPALEQALTIRSAHSRLLVAHAMAGIGDHAKLSVLLAEVQNTNSTNRTNALTLLRSLKSDAVHAVPTLLTVAKNSTNDPGLQTFTAQTIEVISPGAAKAAGLRP